MEELGQELAARIIASITTMLAANPVSSLHCQPLVMTVVSSDLLFFEKTYAHERGYTVFLHLAHFTSQHVCPFCC